MKSEVPRAETEAEVNVFLVEWNSKSQGLLQVEDDSKMLGIMCDERGGSGIARTIRVEACYF